VAYKRIRRVIYRDTEFEKTTSRKIRRQYKNKIFQGAAHNGSPLCSNF